MIPKRVLIPIIVLAIGGVAAVGVSHSQATASPFSGFIDAIAQRFGLTTDAEEA